MERSDFQIGMEFRCADKTYRCTDIGSRTVIAIRIDSIEVQAIREGTISTKLLRFSEAETEGWFDGPPYAVAEIVFDEDEIEACELI